MTNMLSIIYVVIGCMAGAYASILMKKGADSLEFNIKSLFNNKHLINGVLIYGMGTILYIIALRGGELSILYPLNSTTYIWVALLSQKILGEKMNTYKWLGILFILIGVSFIGIGG
ncbi:MAG: 4-amino-4-deoxy-L-arabinose-phosphoundecaprenol flippase subunit ArnE [Candidatus Woesearchaeota archaeon]|nr:4-amino-4-deoxy-L-arabinose-phosphoundecaprenol flippase subunit ArnE [Candidatus Woesearchaeota archaeon]